MVNFLFRLIKFTITTPLYMAVVIAFSIIIFMEFVLESLFKHESKILVDMDTDLRRLGNGIELWVLKDIRKKKEVHYG